MAAIRDSLGDIAEAGRVTGALNIAEAAANTGADGEDEAVITVRDSELGEPPAKKPKH